MALRLLLARQSDAVLEAAMSESDDGEEISSAFSRRPGVEARAAAAAAREVGATLVLGDRPIEITLRRAWEGLSWSERFSLGKLLFFGGDGRVKSETPPTTTAPTPTSLEEIDALSRDPTSLAAVVASLEASYPSLASALVHERDGKFCLSFGGVDVI